MTDIDFYILSAQEPQQRLDFACRLVEKAYRSRCKVYIHLDNDAEAKAFDELLWNYRENSFIPHGLVGSDDLEENCPVYIGSGDQQAPHFDVLLNLATDIPATFARHKRLLEIVIQQDAVLAATRLHYKFYKERGYPINNIDMRISD
jgi:DNA polymerase-3 subunit chi